MIQFDATCDELVTFFINVQNNNKVTLRTLEVNSHGQIYPYVRKEGGIKSLKMWLRNVWTFGVYVTKISFLKPVTNIFNLFSTSCPVLHLKSHIWQSNMLHREYCFFARLGLNYLILREMNFQQCIANYLSTQIIHYLIVCVKYSQGLFQI